VGIVAGRLVRCGPAERRGVISGGYSGSRQVMGPGHPIYGEVIRATLPRGKAQRIASWLTKAGGRSRGRDRSRGQGDTARTRRPGGGRAAAHPPGTRDRAAGYVRADQQGHRGQPAPVGAHRE
jgi:hypothetical protein